MTEQEKKKRTRQRKGPVVFETLAVPTPPQAGEPGPAVPEAAAPAPAPAVPDERQEARPGTDAGEPPGRAFTWRLTGRQGEMLDDLHARVTSTLGVRVPRRDILAALVAEMTYNSKTYRAVIDRMRPGAGADVGG
ncbi:hypothetical protein amrb99_98290 [Actinomadura sp. RB99]|nr:hypothetical protein [Actinomadura sp. RB99]